VSAIEAIAVGVPARDEAARVGVAITAIATAARNVSVPVYVAVTADSCTDDTALVARRALTDAVGIAAWDVREIAAGTAGAARDGACRRALELCGDRPGAATWLATTDADTTVPRRWLRRQLDWADHGADGVAGLVELAAEDGLSARAHRRWHDLVERAGLGIGHPHVHGANLGIRADVWQAAGGFDHCEVGEDHELWRRARALGAELVGVPDIVVRTSARTTGRAPGGLATLLAGFDV
jgi:cellulose synthase/poly-beta-1,6-N-acetylglucosamine synthase-like glycosyltransferase